VGGLEPCDCSCLGTSSGFREPLDEESSSLFMDCVESSASFVHAGSSNRAMTFSV